MCHLHTRLVLLYRILSWRRVFSSWRSLLSFVFCLLWLFKKSAFSCFSLNAFLCETQSWILHWKSYKILKVNMRITINRTQSHFLVFRGFYFQKPVFVFCCFFFVSFAPTPGGPGGVSSGREPNLSSHLLKRVCLSVRNAFLEILKQTDLRPRYILAQNARAIQGHIWWLERAHFLCNG